MNKIYHLWKDNFVLTFRNRFKLLACGQTGTAMKRSLLKTIILAVVLAWSGNAFGQDTFTSLGSGNWNTPANWSGQVLDADGIPDADDNVTIAATHTINLDLDASVNNLSFAAGTSQINFSVASKTLTVFGNIVGVLNTDDYVTAASGLNASGTKILFSGAGTQVLTLIGGSTNWPDFEVNKGGGSLTLSQNTRIDGNLLMTAGTLDAGANAISMSSISNITVAAAASLINVTRVAQTTGGTAKNNALTIDGLFSTSTGAASINTTTLTVNSTGVLDMKGSATGFSNTGGSENPTTMTCNTGSTVKYSGTGQIGRFVSYFNLECAGGTTAGSAIKTISATGTITINNNLTISNGARFTGGGNYVVTGTTTINDNGEISWTGGTGSTFICNGPLNINGNGGNGVIRFGGASTTTPTYTFNGDVTVSAATTVSAFNLNSGTAGVGNRTFEGVINFNGNVTVASGAATLTSTTTADPASTNIRFGGTNKSLTLSTGTSFVNLRGDITFTTSRTISAPGGGGFTFTTRPSSVTPEWAVQIDNGATLTVSPGAYISLPNRIISNGTGAGNLQVDGDLRIGLPGGWDSTITNTGTTSLGSASTITFNGALAQVTGTSFPSTTVKNLTVNNALGVTLSGNTTVNSTLALTTGTLSTGANTLTLKGTTSGTGFINTGATGTLVYNGAVAQSVSNLTASTANAVIIDNAAGVTIGTNTIVNTDLTLNAGSLATLVSGRNLTVNNAVINNGTLTIENNANLIQVNNVANTGLGSTIVKRNSSPLLRLDYTLWSSPVASKNLVAFSPLTSLAPSRFYTFDTTFNTGGVNGAYAVITDPTIATFSAGAGYLIRMPNTADAVTPTAYAGQFTGIPNNGDVPVSLVDGAAAGLRFNLVGNPYPSTLKMQNFVFDNTASIENTLWFWRKTNGAGTAYCTWQAGALVTDPGTFVTNGNTQTVDPQGIIQTAQGFFVEAKSGATSLTFKNNQRVANNVGQFFKTKQVVASSKIWLNATNVAGDFSQMAITYFDGATVGVDAFDGKYINDSAFALTSNVNNGEYTIQGRPTFDSTDVVALNFKTDVAGDYTIAIDHTEGVFASGQDIYLVDSKTGTETNLTTSAYNFTAVAGVDNTRFSLKYQKTLKVDDAIFNQNSVTVYAKNGSLYISSVEMDINTIQVFDVQGRLIAERKNVKATSAIVDNLKANNQVLLVKVSGENNQAVTKKVMN